MTARAFGAAIALVVASGCGGSLTSAMDAGGTGNLPGDDAAVVDVPVADAQGDATVVTDAGGGQDALACGAMTCGADQVCVSEYCGGGPNPCMAPTDGGACPDGWHLEPSSSCPSANDGPGCYPPPCTNPPPHCADLPAACNGTPSCSCAASACWFASCAFAFGRSLTCAAI